MDALISRRVVCGGCGALMEAVKVLAMVTWKWKSGDVTSQRYWQYDCNTPDCGNTVQVEED